LPLLAIILVLISCFTHATWNLLARQHRSEMAFFQRMLFIIATVGLVPFALSEAATRSIPTLGWFCVLGSGICGGVYMYSLARAYSATDFSIVYPVARALPVLLVGLGDVLRNRPMTAPGWAGLVLVFVGCMLTPLQSLRAFKLRNYLHSSMLWILGTALGTVGYSLLDKIASEVVVPGPATAIRYCYAFFSLSALVLLVLSKSAPLPQNKQTVGWRMPLLGALCFFASYCLVLRAYQLSDRAGYVVAFRQFSIIIGVVLAFLIYKERWTLARILGVGLICTGLILVGVFGG